MPLTEDALTFLKYPFSETKDLVEHFLTLITAVLVFSLTFSEKIASFNTAKKSTRWTITVAWCCMLLSIIGAGISLCYVALAGGAASANGTLEQCWAIMNTAIAWIGGAGILFLTSLLLMLIAAIQTAWKRRW